MLHVPICNTFPEACVDRYPALSRNLGVGDADCTEAQLALIAVRSKVQSETLSPDVSKVILIPTLEYSRPIKT